MVALFYPLLQPSHPQWTSNLIPRRHSFLHLTTLPYLCISQPWHLAQQGGLPVFWLSVKRTLAFIDTDKLFFFVRVCVIVKVIMASSFCSVSAAATPAAFSLTPYPRVEPRRLFASPAFSTASSFNMSLASFTQVWRDDIMNVNSVVVYRD